jgi:hypothetical protein
MEVPKFIGFLCLLSGKTMPAESGKIMAAAPTILYPGKSFCKDW